MPRKKLPHYQICRVEEVPKDDPQIMIRLQQLPLDALQDAHHAPDGTFITWLDTLYLPKRKRGTKFLATYTQVFQKEL